MKIRKFMKEDLPAVVDLWNTSLGKDGKEGWYLEENLLSEEKLEKAVKGPNSDPMGIFVACDGRKITGFGKGAVKKYKSYEDEKPGDLPGYLERLIVAPEYRRKGAGTEFLRNIESFVKAEGKDKIEISYYFPAVTGVPVLPKTPEYEFLLKKGYNPLVREIKLRLVFRNFTLRDEIIKTREVLRQEGIEIRYFKKGDKNSFSMLMEKYFPDWWNGFFKTNMEREKPVLIAADGDRVAGFVGPVNVEENRRAGFAPGVDPEYRKRGIGRILVNLWADEVKKMGAEESIIETVADNYSAQHIYFDMGYEKIGEFIGKFEKNIM